MSTQKLTVAIVVAGLAIASDTKASLTVSLVSVSPDQTVNLDIKSGTTTVPSYDGGVYAGIYNLKVNGVATPSFCIDVARDETVGESLSDYSYATLSSAPENPSGPMGLTHAADIEKLWAAYYSSAVSDHTGLMAAALQLAIWENLGDGSLGYTVGSDPLGAYYNSAVVTEAGKMLAALPTLTAEVGLEAVISPQGQNYVIVPEPTTLIAGAMLLLPFGASTLRFVRKSRTTTGQEPMSQ